MPYPMPQLCSAEMWGPRIWLLGLSSFLRGTGWLVTHYLDPRTCSLENMVHCVRSRFAEPGQENFGGGGSWAHGRQKFWAETVLKQIWTFFLHFVGCRSEVSSRPLYHLPGELTFIHDSLQVSSRETSLIYTQTRFLPLSYHSVF